MKEISFTKPVTKVSHRITGLRKNDDGSVTGTCVTASNPSSRVLESMSDYKFGIQGFLDKDKNLNITAFNVIAP